MSTLGALVAVRAERGRAAALDGPHDFMLGPGDGIASGIVFQQELDQCDDVGGFFSTGLRPPPERRVRPGDTF